MNERFHIIITGEQGRSIALQVSKRKCYLVLAAFCSCLLAISIFGYFTSGSYLNSKRLAKKVETLKTELGVALAETQQLAEQIVALTEDYSEQMADLQLRADLENTNLQLENIRLMTTAVRDLNERSQLIETVMDTVGVELSNTKEAAIEVASSGGPFIPFQETSYEALLKKADDYLKTVQSMPLGKPLQGSISSGYGKRTDPVNGKSAFHEGVDIRGKRGDKIHTTASGKVVKAFKNGGYGNYVEIDHGNGYKTVYAHMQNYLVKKGEFVNQGQVIGQVGNSGRSTGPHLHYEVRLNNKLVDPAKFMKVAKLSHTFSTHQE